MKSGFKKTHILNRQNMGDLSDIMALTIHLLDVNNNKENNILLSLQKISLKF